MEQITIENIISYDEKQRDLHRRQVETLNSALYQTD